jgi:hypothetical protein
MRCSVNRLGLVFLITLAAGCGADNGAEPASEEQASGSAAGASGGTKDSGAAPGTGGKTGSAGSTGTGGTTSSGGHTGTGGTTGSGGATGSGGSPGIGGSSPTGTPPNLVPGVWTNITPSNLDLSKAGSGVLCVAIDPTNTAVLYICVEKLGIWKTTDSGATWVPLSTATVDPIQYDKFTPFLDIAINIAIDPLDPKHMYATEGVRGANNGFWISHDGSQSWSVENFAKFAPSYDFTTLVVDSTDFRHVLIGSHYCCTGALMESKDAGDTWKVFTQGIPQGTFGIGILNHPASGTGNTNTWEIHADGMLRTSDAGQTWTKVSNVGGIHGATEIYYTSAGVLYSGAAGNPLRSTDNGLTWTQVDAGGGGVYPTVIGDGHSLYVFMDNFHPSTCKTSLETDGVTWTTYNGGQVVPRAPLMMRFDPVSRVIYSANWDQGIWALRVIDP